MKKILLFVLLSSLIISCNQEQLKPLDKISSPDDALVKEIIPSFQDNLDPSILNSAWWRELDPMTKQMMSIELSNDSNPMTLKELLSRKKKSIDMLQDKKKACPGFPVANPEGDVTLNSQADVNAFGALKCKEITGALVVVDTFGPDPICDLTPLKGLKEIGSSMTIDSDCLTNLAGLEKLKSIGELGPFGFMGVNGDNIVDIEALSKLSTVTGSINIIDCDQLTSITNAFSKITSIDSSQTSVLLTSLWVLNINDNELLSDLSGFSNITNIDGGLRILTNASLLDLDDFNGLTTIGDDIIVLENVSLQNVNGLSNISSIQDDLFVFDNTALTECCGLFNLLCSDPPACTTSGVGDVVAIFNNGAGCTEVDITSNGPCM